MLYWMSSEFILVAASSAVLCQASVSFNKKNNEHEDSFIVWERISVHGTAFYSEINFPSLSGNLFLLMELLFLQWN